LGPLDLLTWARPPPDDVKDPFLSEGAVKPPIFMTSTFVFRRVEDGEQCFNWAYGLEERRSDEPMGLIDSRLNNPGL
jgi:methionine-gamma-lyase